ncbi:MAG: response regulator [Rhodocyclaceae bacterium]
MQADTCSTRDAGKLLGVSLRTVQLWVDGGLLEAWKTVGGHRRITIASVKRLQEERTVARSTGEPKTAVRAGRKPVVLVVEDDADLLMLYETTLSLWEPPVTVLTANNGFDGLLRIGEAPPDLLITDLSMPGIDGFQMLRSLRANPTVGDMRIAVVTGLDKDDIALRGGIPDDVALFRKPVPFEHLKSLLDDLPALRRPRAA